MSQAGSFSYGSSNNLYEYTNVATSPYVVTADDYYLSVNSSSIPITIELPDAPQAKRVFIIKDRAGNCSTNNITVTTVSGLANIDGNTTFVMNTDFMSIQLVFNGFNYEVY